MFSWLVNSRDFAVYLALTEKVLWSRQSSRRNHYLKMQLLLLQFIWLHSQAFLEPVCFISLLCLLNHQPGSRHCFLLMTSRVFSVSEAGKQLRAGECWHTAIAQRFWCGGNWLFKAVGERHCKHHWCWLAFLVVGHLLASADTIKAVRPSSHLQRNTGNSCSLHCNLLSWGEAPLGIAVTLLMHIQQPLWPWRGI